MNQLQPQRVTPWIAACVLWASLVLPGAAGTYLEPVTLEQYRNRFSSLPHVFEPIRPGIIEARWVIQRQPTIHAGLYINEETLEVVGETEFTFDDPDKSRRFAPQQPLFDYLNSKGVVKRAETQRLKGIAVGRVLTWTFPDKTRLEYIDGPAKTITVYYPNYDKALKPKDWRPRVLPEERLRAQLGVTADSFPEDPEGGS